MVFWKWHAAISNFQEMLLLSYLEKLSDLCQPVKMSLRHFFPKKWLWQSKAFLLMNHSLHYKANKLLFLVIPPNSNICQKPYYTSLFLKYVFKYCRFNAKEVQVCIIWKWIQFTLFSMFLNNIRSFSYIYSKDSGDLLKNLFRAESFKVKHLGRCNNTK